MYKQSDSYNIFNSYIKNVVLNEAVMDTEEDPNAPMPDAATLKATRERLKAERAKEVIAARDALKTQTGKSSGNVQKQEDGSYIATEPQQQPDAELVKSVDILLSSKDLPDDLRKMLQHLKAGDEIESDTLSQTTTTQSVAMADDGSAVSPEEIQASQQTQYTTVPSADSDEEEKKHKKRVKLDEKNNISKFLRHLSEKNYSSANKYLKAILNSKINKNVSDRIDKI
jgi:hypothetical protein